MDMRLLVGYQVKRLRSDKGMTQEALAVKSGLSQQYISGLEAGGRNPTVITLHELAAALGVTPVDLITPPGGQKLRRISRNSRG
jgi:transcriptional regulator with XRE-family HTH domain